ncbi:MAG: branched-chain amino acid ABC transporter substrate-binding protein [Hamadaea sp.]|nr:branched-chain amino acid ABC transporter substrate-binding protein [Hamadaea sp.]
MGAGRIVAGWALAAVVAAGAGGCTPTPRMLDSGDACGYKIAFFGALTGDNANLGRHPYDGAKLAVDQYNAAHRDCPVELAGFDSQGDEKLSPDVAQRIAADPRILGVVGPQFSGEAEAAVPILDEAGLTVVTATATRPALAEQGWKVFHRAIGSDAVQGPAAARYIRNVLGSRRVIVIDDASAYGKGLADEVRRVLAGVIVKSLSVRVKQGDFSREVADVRASEADAVFYGGYYAEAGPLLKQLRGGGVRAAFVAADGVKDPGLVQGAGAAAAEGTVLTCPCVPPDRVKGTFLRDFREAYQREPGTYSAEAFDAANILLAGIDAGNHTRPSLLAYVDSYVGEGVTKTFKFDGRGEIAQASVVIWAYRVVNGEIVADQQILGDGSS